MIAFITILVLAAAGCAAWGILEVAFQRRRRLDKVLAAYAVGQVTEAGERHHVAGTRELLQLSFLRNAVARVAELASRRGLLQLVERQLKQADLPLRPAEMLFFYVTGTLVGGVLGAVLGGAVWAVIVLAALAVCPWIVVEGLAAKRTGTFTEQLPETLQMLGSSLRSGFSLLQGLESVSRQIQGPLGKDMRHVVVEARLGRPLVSALEEVAQRVRSEDFSWVVTAIAIQREVGGNLAELLDIVAATMLARARLRREARTLTAEGRIGAIIISVMPVAIGLFVYAVNPSYIRPLFHTAAGELLFYGSIVLGVLGVVWIRKVVRFEV